MESPILYVNACVRNESRTKRLAERLLVMLDKPYEEIRLQEISFPPSTKRISISVTNLVSWAIIRIPCLNLLGSFRKRRP